MKRTHALAAVAILLSAQLSSAVTFFNLLGHRADNCASELWNFRYNSGTAAVPARNCIQAGRVNQEPASSNVVLLPLQFTRGPLVPAALTVTVTGNGFDRLNGQASVCLGLPTNDPSRYCTGGQLGFGCDTTLSILTLTASTAFPTSFPQAATFTIPLGGNPGDWNQNFMEFDPAPRPLCWNPAGPSTPRGPFTETTGFEFPSPAVTTVAGVPTINSPFIWTGFTVGVAWNCSDSANPCTNRLPANSVAPANQLQQAYVSSLTQCCPGNPQAEFAGGAMSVCINPNVQQCCGNTQFNLGVEKCCNQGQSTTAFINGACRCSNIGGNNDCSNGAENTCCLQTKFPVTNNAVLNQTGTTVDVFGFQWGQCYDPTSEQCCNTGYRFDPATHVCCPINGLQTADQPCPCQADTDCAGVGAGNQRCCLQEAPALTGATCNIFANFPSGQAPSENQRCNGVCINRAWQVCCNGVPCVRNYEKCCNDTCCNKFTGSCLFARRGAAAGFSSNNVEVTEWYEQCSTVEHLDTVKSYLLFALPATLLLSSLSVLALALVFANKSSARVFSLLERVLIACAVLSIFLVFPVFFSHLYKYAEVVVFASIVAIFTASVRVRWLNIFSIVVLAITVIYIFDPFYGNAFLTLAYQRQYNSTQLFSNPRDDPHFFIHGTQDPATSGLFHSTAQLFFNSRQTLEVQACTTFYDYFILDQDLLDIGRIDNPEIVTFGYCSRAYVIALLYFEAFVGLFVLLQFVLAMLALIVRFRKTRFDPIELEVRQILLDE